MILTSETLVFAGIGVLLVLLVLSAFFSSAEIAMFSLAEHRLAALVEDGVDGARTAAALKEDPHRLLVTILVGNNLVNIAMSSVATGLCALYLGRGQAVVVATLGVTAVVLLFGESAPKSYAIENSESWALRVARPLKLSEYVLYPLVVTFDRLTRVVNRVTGGGTAIETSYVTREEIREMIRTGENEDVIDADEREMLQRILRFTGTIAKEVMTPRPDVTAVPRDADVEEAITTCIRSGHHRLPVYGDSLDDVVGIVELHDLVREFRYGEGDLDTLDQYVQEVLQVPESKSVDDLFEEMRRERVGMAVVVDEFGTTEGLITTEDLVEEIVGEILDAEEEEPISVLDDTTVRVNGDVNVDEVNDVLGIDLPEGEEFETVAGFVFNRAGQLVEEGEAFTHDGSTLTVESVDDARVTRVRITEQRDQRPAEGRTEASS